MKNTKATTWVLGTVLLALVLLAGTWFLAISPKMESSAEMRAQTESELAQVDQLEIQLAGLKADFENIETFRAELAALRVQMPTGAELATLTRQIDGLAAASGVFVTNVSPSNPVAVVPPTAAAATTAETDTATTAEAAPSITGLYSVPIQVTVLGGYPQTLDFISRLQVQNPRLVLVVSFVSTAQDASGAQGGKPAVAAGDLETAISAYAYVVVDPTADAAAVPSDEVLPVPSGQANPFATNS